MKLSKKIKRWRKHESWVVHARQLEREVAELTAQRTAQAGLIEALGNEGVERTTRARPRTTLAALGLVGPEVVAILIAVMKKAGVDQVMVDPRRAWCEHGEHTGDTIQVDRNPADGTLILTLKNLLHAGERAIVIGEPEQPCAPERNGLHNWYPDGHGGAVCRCCGLRTIRKGDPLEPITFGG